MKRYLSFVLALALALSLTGCLATAPEETVPPATEPVVTEAPTDPVEETEAEETEPSQPSRSVPTNMQLPETEAPSKTDPLEVPEDAEMLTMTGDILTPEPSKGLIQDPEDPYRPRHDLGNNYELEGTVFFLLIFLDDNESIWSSWEAEAFINETFFPGLQFLTDQAYNWGVSLTCECAYYITDDSVDSRYAGTVGDFNSNNIQVDIMEQAAAALGYGTVENMDEAMKEYSGRDQIVYSFVMNKPGRCYAYSDWYNDDVVTMEYCVLFAEPVYENNLVYDCVPATVAHEILHLFGAEDYYAEGYDRVRRSQLASQYYYNDLMLNTYYDIRYNYVSEVTAYSIGWIDWRPQILLNDDWWD